MYCPVCRCEYRAGFTRCASCDEELVEALEPETTEGGFESGRLLTDPGPMMDFCGFVTLEDAREARDSVWNRGMPAEIAIRPVPGCLPGSAIREEYWLRIGRKTFQMVADLLGYDTAESGPGTGPEASAANGLRCSDCGQPVAAQETFCPACGARFEEAR